MEDEPDAQGPPVELSDEETAVMLGHFAGASFSALASQTGLPADRLEVIVTRLTRLGLIEAQLIPLEEEPAEAAPLAVPFGEIETLPGEIEGDAPERPVRRFDLEEDPPSADGSLVALLDDALDGLLAPAPPAPEGEAAGGAPAKPRVAAAAAAPEHAKVEEATEEVIDLAVEEPRVEAVEETREYLKLFETELHPLPTDERVALAGTVSGARLFALCFDPEPFVIRAIFTNSATTVEHARLVAFHHRTGRGLDELVRRSAICSDPLVHRRLVRNPAVDEATFRKLMGSKRLLEIYKVSLDRDVPERSRAAARVLFRNKFTTAQPEERVDLVWATEGRVLVAMTGLTFDSRSTTILCSRNYASIMLIQSLARFPATPPQLIAHLLRQPLVKRQVHLKNQLLSHPNTPSDAKRRV